MSDIIWNKPLGKYGYFVACNTNHLVVFGQTTKLDVTPRGCCLSKYDEVSMMYVVKEQGTHFIPPFESCQVFLPAPGGNLTIVFEHNNLTIANFS